MIELSEWEKVLSVLKVAEMALVPKTNTSSLSRKCWRPQIFAILGVTALSAVDDPKGLSFTGPVNIYVKEKYLEKKRSTKDLIFLDKFRQLMESKYGLKYQLFENSSAGGFILKQIYKLQKDAEERDVTTDTVGTESLVLLFKPWKDNHNIYNLLKSQPKKEQVLLNTEELLLLEVEGNDLVTYNPQVQDVNDSDILYAKFQMLIDNKQVPSHNRKPIKIPFKPKSARSLLDKFTNSKVDFEKILEDIEDSDLFKNSNDVNHLAFIICVNGKLLKYTTSSSYVEQLLRHFLGEDFLPVDYQASDLIDDPIFQQLAELILDVSIDEIFFYSTNKNFEEEESEDSTVSLEFTPEDVLDKDSDSSLNTTFIQDIKDMMVEKSSQEIALLDFTFSSDVRSGLRLTHH